MPNIRSNLSPKCARGYIYDAETQLYYCQSRYYDPALGRFLNTDAFTSTGQGILGNNMFAYCNNNPVNCSDPSGTITLGGFLGAVTGGAIAGAFISSVSYIVSCGLNGVEVSSSGLFDAAKSGAISGAIGGAIGTISVGASVVAAFQKILPSATAGMLTVGAKALASAAAGMYMSQNQTERGIMATSASASTFLGSLIDATNNSFWGSAFCNYAATLFVGTALEVATVSVKQASSNHQQDRAYRAPRAVAERRLLY